MKCRTAVSREKVKETNVSHKVREKERILKCREDGNSIYANEISIMNTKKYFLNKQGGRKGEWEFNGEVVLLRYTVHMCGITTMKLPYY
jgi:hypothetical protein